MPCRFVAVLLIGLVSAAAGVPVQKATDQPRWHNDFRAAQAEARRAGKPIFAVLH